MYKITDKVLVTGVEGSFVGEVVRITPKGFLIVRRLGTRYEYTFRPDGIERNSNRWRKHFIQPITEKDNELLEMKALRVKADKAYGRICKVLTKEQCETIISWKEQAGV